MFKKPCSSKRKTSEAESVVPAKRFINVPEALLRSMTSSLFAATLGLVALPCADIAARGRVVAVIAECRGQLNNVLGLRRRGTSVFAVSDIVIDVFRFVRRKELDVLQIVSALFNAIVENNMTLVCLRSLRSARLLRSGENSQLTIIINEPEKVTPIPIDVDDETVATARLLNACKSSVVDSLQLYGAMPMDAPFLDFLAVSATTIFVKDFNMRNRPLSDGVADENFLRMVQAFAELYSVRSTAKQDANLQCCLIRSCFKAGVTLRSPCLALDKDYDTSSVEDALMEFSFGTCDEQFATRERFMDIEISTTLQRTFLHRWIEKAESQAYRHRLTLFIKMAEVLRSQDTSSLSIYKRNDPDEWDDREPLFESVKGRQWTVKYRKLTNGREYISFKICH